MVVRGGKGIGLPFSEFLVISAEETVFRRRISGDRRPAVTIKIMDVQEIRFLLISSDENPPLARGSSL